MENHSNHTILTNQQLDQLIERGYNKLNILVDEVDQLFLDMMKEVIPDPVQEDSQIPKYTRAINTSMDKIKQVWELLDQLREIQDTAKALISVANGQKPEIKSINPN